MSDASFNLEPAEKPLRKARSLRVDFVVPRLFHKSLSDSYQNDI